MKKFTILVDMDDTLVNTVKTWVNWLNAKHHLNVRYEDITDWNLSIAFPTLTLAQLYEPLGCQDFWKLVTPKHDAQVFLRFLIEDGHNVYIASASHYLTVKYKIHDCLFKHFPYLNHKQLIFINNKQLLNADFLIDDGIHNLTDAKYRGILVTTPYNQHINEKDIELDMIRVTNWEEIYNFIKEQANDEN